MSKRNRANWTCKACKKRLIELHKMDGAWKLEILTEVHVEMVTNDNFKIHCATCGHSEFPSGRFLKVAKRSKVPLFSGVPSKIPELTREDEKRKKDINFQMDFDIGTKKTCRNNETVLFSPFSHLVKSGRAPKTVRYAFIEVPTSISECHEHTHFILGAFGLSQQNMLSFFPSHNFPINVAGKVVEGVEQPPDGKNYEHFTLEPDRRTWHMTPSLSKLKSVGRRTNGNVEQIDVDLFHWFSKSFSKFSDMEPLYKRYLLKRWMETGAVDIRTSSIEQALGKNFYDIVKPTDLRIKNTGSWCIQTEFFIYEGQDDAKPFKLPDLTPVVPHAIIPDSFSSTMTKVAFPEAGFNILVSAIIFNGFSTHNSYSSFKH